MIVVAVDPGKTCGIAWTFDYVEARAAEFSPLDTALITEDLHPDLIVVERYIPRTGRAATWQPDAVETTGMLKLVAHMVGCQLEIQTPANAKRFSTNDKLTRMGWRRPSTGGHMDDAMRHLLLAGVRHGLVDEEQYR